MVVVILYKYSKAIHFFALIFLLSMIQLLHLPFSVAEEFLHKSYTGYSNAQNSYTAKKEILDKAVAAISKEIIVEMIGEEKYQQKKSLIDTKIIKLYAKYIPLLHQKATKKEKETYLSTVKLSVSIDTLRAMLLEQGLLYESGHVPILLPMVAFHLNRKAPFRWWFGFSSDLDPKIEKKLHSFHSILQKTFFNKGFYSFRPHFFCFACNVSYIRNTSFLQSQEIKQFADFFNSELVLSGDLKIHSDRKKSFYLLNWQARQSKDSKVLVHLKERRDISYDKVYNSPTFQSFIQDASERMAQRILLLWQQGRLGIQVLELMLAYPVSIIESAKIKSLVSQIRGVKNLNEYKIDHRSMSYFVYANVSAERIANELSALDSSYFQGKISHYGDKIVVQRK